MHALRGLCAGALAAVLASSSAQAQAPASSSFTGVARVVAFADVHGAYDELLKLLTDAGVIDAGQHWSAGAAHVVSTGDLLDRGADSRKVMDLLMRLETEAAAAGGRMHVTLGNHEAMNVLGDLRYVARDEFAAYTADEAADLREREKAAFLARNPGDPAAFDKLFPPGFYGHRALLGPDGKYGQWLLARPVVIQVNDTVFMHGGPSTVLNGLSLQDINLRYRTALTDYLGALKAAEAAGVVLPEDAYSARPKLAAERVTAAAAQDPRRPAMAAAADALKKADENPMLESDGPNWYRGAAMCNQCSEADVLMPFMQRVGAKRLVIGHTVARDATVVSRFDGTVVKLDTGMNRKAYQGRPSALIFEGGNVRVLYAGVPGGPAEIPAEPLFVGSDSVADGDAIRILEAGTVTVTGPRAPNVLDVTVQHNGKSLPAAFLALPSDTAKRELAAMKVDRLLGLGLVPATVEREVQGQRGILQLRPAKWATQAEVQQKQVPIGGWCALPPQFELMYAFDGLIGNEARTADRIAYDVNEGALLLIGHDRTFGTSRDLPRHLQARPPAPGAELRRRLTALDAGKLKAALDGLVSDREIKAMIERRDAVLASAARPAAAGR